MAFDQQRKDFYERLSEGAYQFEGFGPLPKIVKKDRYTPLWHLCRAHHVANPDMDPDLRWLKIYDDQPSWMLALPEGMCPEGIDTMEAVKSRMDTALARINRYARLAKAEYGEIQVKRVQGRIYIRHMGEVPR